MSLRHDPGPGRERRHVYALCFGAVNKYSRMLPVAPGRRCMSRRLQSFRFRRRCGKPRKRLLLGFPLPVRKSSQRFSQVVEDRFDLLDGHPFAPEHAHLIAVGFHPNHHVGQPAEPLTAARPVPLVARGRMNAESALATA